MRLPIASIAALATSLGLSATTLSSSGGISSAGGSSHHGATARVTSPALASLRYGRSVGSPTDGHLVGGTHLDDTGYLRVVPADASGDVRWGVAPLVDMIDRSARAVRRQYPDAVTSLGHLSREGGGDIDQHRSHESGRDADVGFFIRTSTGKPLMPTHFVAFQGDGTARTWPGAYFDDARNWALVASMLADPEAHVTHVFVAAPLRARLLAYADHVGAPAQLRMRAAELMQQPRGALPHDDHFHVRIGCPARMSGCIENPMMRPRKPELLAHGRRGGAAHGASPAGATAATLAEPAARAPSHLHPLPGEGNAPPSEQPAAPGAPAAPEPTTPDAPPATLATPIDDVDG
jgi:penicillin-insensitive murein endopeptidase